MSHAAQSPRVALIALNAHFAHTSLALRLLREQAAADGFPREQLSLCEWTINDLPQQLLQRLFAQQADVYAFSCYIWNRRLTERLSDELRKIRPDALILWGGPEASQDAEAILNRHPAVDAILSGEGEKAFSKFLNNLTLSPEAPEACFAATPNLIYRTQEGAIQQNPMAPLLSPDQWVFPYTSEELIELKDRLIYFETSRGCPYGCTYCLSSLDRSVRLLPQPDVERVFDQLINAGLRQVKLVDRTFNIQPQRAAAIWNWLIERHRSASLTEKPFATNFHFEIMADQLDQAALKLLEQAPEGLIQFEIGVQTTTPDVLKAIHRPCNGPQLSFNVERLRNRTPIHLHLDLIAGLPGETFEQFCRSFNDVFALNPHQLQLGFLKVLPGSPMAVQARDLNFRWSEEPPYEILASDQMTYADLARLKDVETVLELYHNSGRFGLALPSLLNAFSTPFDLFDALAKANRQAGWFEQKASPSARAAFLLDFARAVLPAKDQPDFLSRLKLDYIHQGAKDLPAFLDLLENSSDPDRRLHLKDGKTIVHRDYPRQSRFRLEDLDLLHPVSLQAAGLVLHPNWAAAPLAELPSGKQICGFDLQTSPLRLLFVHSRENSENF